MQRPIIQMSSPEISGSLEAFGRLVLKWQATLTVALLALKKTKRGKQMPSTARLSGCSKAASTHRGSQVAGASTLPSTQTVHRANKV